MLSLEQYIHSDPEILSVQTWMMEVLTCSNRVKPTIENLVAHCSQPTHLAEASEIEHVFRPLHFFGEAFFAAVQLTSVGL